MCYFSSHTVLLGLSFLSYTKLDLICRNQYCCSQSINLGTKFAGHSYIKSSKGALLHRSIRLERELIYQVNWELGSKKGGRRNTYLLSYLFSYLSKSCSISDYCYLCLFTSVSVTFSLYLSLSLFLSPFLDF